MVGRYILLFLLGALLAVPGCVSENRTYTGNGSKYGTTDGSFRGRWWNYYERGRSFADGRLYREAEQDFKKAIAGRARDQWRARTYGMHFVDYFPHRELGVVYFQGKRYDQAIAELEQSVRSAPSAKGHYFLNKARAEQLRRSGRDKEPPRLRVDAGPPGVTNAFVYTVSGTALDDTYVAAIRVADRLVPVELARREQDFSVDVPLAEGENSIRIVATDLVGRTTAKELTIFSDRQGPLIEIQRLETEGGRKIVKGVVRDGSGLASLRLNGVARKLPASPRSYDFSLVQTDTAEIVAVDLAGNATRAVLRRDELGLRPVPGRRLAALESPDAVAGVPVVASDAHAPMVQVAAAPPVDTEPPFIKLEGVESGMETYEEFVLLEGMAVDFSAVASLSVNGEPLSVRTGRKLYFSQLKELDEGANVFVVVAVDTRGNRSEKKITVTRKVQKIRQVGSRMSLAVLPFEHRGEESLPGEIVYDQLVNSLLEQKRFKVIERKKIDAVLRELQLAGSGLVDPDEAVRLGRIVAANGMLTGTIIESPDSVEIIGRLIDTETATILASNDVFGEGKSFGGLSSLLDGLAFKFKRDFPLVEGILIEVRGDEVVLDIGTEKRLKPYQRLICYREGAVIQHPVTGRILGSEPEIVGEVTVSEVFENFSKARLRNRLGEVRPHDRVIVR